MPIDLAKDELGIKDEQALAEILKFLSDKVHPLVLGQIFRSRAQIRTLADSLLKQQGLEAELRQRVIEFLCSASGSHDRTINRREASELGLKIEKPTQELYEILRELYEDVVGSFQARSRFDASALLGGQPQATFECERVLIESVDGGSACYVTSGIVRVVQIPQVAMPQVTVSGCETAITFEGWKTS